MSLKSEIVVDKVSPLGGLFEIKGKLQITKPNSDTVIFDLDPDTGTISNNDFTLGHNDLDIPVFTFKDKNGFSILTDLTTENLSGRNNPNKGIKLQSNPLIDQNRITIGNLTDSLLGIPSLGLGAITIQSEDLINYKNVSSSITLKSANTIIVNTTGSVAFRITDVVSKKKPKTPHTNVFIGVPNPNDIRHNKIKLYKGTDVGYDGSTPFLGTDNRTIVRNKLEVLNRTHIKGDLKVGIGSVDDFATSAKTVFTHLNNYTSTFSPQTVEGTGGPQEIYVLQSDVSTYAYDSGLYQNSNASTILQTAFDNAGSQEAFLLVYPFLTFDQDPGGSGIAFIAGEALIAGIVDIGGEATIIQVPDNSGLLNPSSKGQLTIIAGREDGNAAVWVQSASLGHYGADISASNADGTFRIHATASDDFSSGFVSSGDVGRDNQPAIKSKGSLTILIDTDNEPEDRFFEVVSGIDLLDEFNSQKSLLTVTPSDERTTVKHLSSSGDLFASTSFSDNETTANSHKLVVVDTASGKFFHKDVTSTATFTSLSDTPNEYSIPEVETLNPESGQFEITEEEINFASHSLVVNGDGDGIEFVQAVPSASFALTASHLLGEAEGIGFPYAGSDILGGNPEANPVIPAQAVITGSLLLSGSGNITASGHISASAITASSFLGTFTGSLSGSVTNAVTSSFLDATASNATFAISASYISGIMSGSLFGNVTGSLHGTASHAESASNAVTASYILATNVIGDIIATDATTAASGGSDSQPFYVVNDALVNGDLTVSGSLGVGESITLADVTFSSSADAFIFGSSSNNTITHQMTGNLAISASTGITLDVPVNTAGFIGTSSWAMSASQALFASESLAAISSSYILASGIDGDITAVNAVSASYVTGVMSGSITGSFTGSMTGSLLGTASWAHSASNAVTASYISASNIDGQIGFPFSGSAQITGSLAVTESIHVQTTVQNVVGVFATASHAESSSHAFYASESISSSYALTASYIAAADIDGQTGFPFTGSATISGSLSVEGENGSITASGHISASAFSSSITNAVGFFGTASHAESASNAVTASYVLSSGIEGDITATNAISASYVTGVMSGSITGSFTGSMTGSLLGTASLASFAESITDNTMFLTQLKDVPNTDGGFIESNDFGYPSSHAGYILAVSGNNQEMFFTETASYASHSLSSSHAVTASHAFTAAFAINTTPSPTQFQALTDVSTTANSVDEDTSPLSYANIAWGAGNTIIYTTAHTGSFTGSFDGILTGSVHGTASHAESSSHAATASYIDVTDIEGNISATNALTASFVTGTMSGSLHGTASWALSASNALFASESLTALSASYLSSFLDIDDVPNNYDLQADFALVVSGNNEGIAFVQTVPSASVAITASYIDATGIEGNITATNALTASFVTGVMSGSITGSFTGSMTGSLLGTASWAYSASNAISASYISGVLTGSLYGTASWALSASNAISASYISASNIDGIITATDATTAASGGSDTQPFYVVNDAFISGNLVVCGSLGVAESVTLDDVVLEASSDAFIFGHNAANTITHQMTGNLELSASTGITANMSENVVGFHGTASHAESASHAATASYIDLGDINGDFVGFPYAGSDILGGNPENNPVIPAQAVITGSLFLSGSGYITASNISASDIIAKSLQIDNAQSITALDSEGTVQDIVSITDGNITTFGDNDLDTKILGDSITLDSSNGIIIDSDNGEVLFQDGGVTSITFNTTNGAITASNISASTFSSSLSSGIGFHGTASYAMTASLVVTASHALTASYIDVTDIEGTITSTNAISASYVTGVMSGSMTGSFTGSMTGSLLGTASWAYSASNAISASYISGVLTGSLYGTASWAYNASSSIIAQTASFLLGDVEGAISASYASSSSVAVNAGTASILTSYLNILDTPSTFADHASHSVVVNVDANALEFVQTVDSASVAVFASQSQLAVTASYIDLENIEGDLVTTFTALTDTDVPAGTSDDPYVNNDVIIVHNNKLIMTGSVPLATTADTASHFEGTVTNAEFATSHSVSASYVGPGGIMSGSLHGTASWAHSASQALFASESLVALSASYFSGVLTGSLHGTASQALFASESIVAISASYVSGVLTGSLYGTASWAGTASHALNANPFPFTGFAVITGSLDLIGSITTQSNAIQNSLSQDDSLLYITSSVDVQSGYPIRRMFNNITGSTPSINTSALWHETLSTTDLTVDYDIHGKLGISPVIDRIGLMFNTETGEVGSYNRQIQISGSNDGGVTFTPISQEAYPSTQPSRSFAFNNIDPYKLYRFKFPSDQNFRSDTQDASDSLAIEEIFLYSDQGSVTANNFYGPLVGTASYALTASISDFTISSSHAETASFFDGEIANAINAEFATSHSVSASYVGPDGIMSGSLHGTASWAYSASNALFASESLSAISASYISGVLTGSLHGTASWAYSASNALFASESLFAISASYFSGTLESDLTGTASYATLASQSETVQVSVSSNEQDSPILFSLDTTPAGEFVAVHADPSMSYNAFTDTFNVPNISSSNITASVVSASQFTGSFYGTASWAGTASHALNTVGGIGFPYSGSDTLSTEPHSQALITGSLYLTGSGNITASGHISASAITASSFLGTFTGSLSGSVKNAETASFLDATASYATHAMSGGTVTQPFHVVNDAFVSGTLFVSGNIATAESITIHDVTISQSANAFTFGSSSNNTIVHQMTGNLALSAITGITANMSANVVGFIGTASHAETASVATSMHGTASWAYSASNALFASESLVAISASYFSGVLTGSLHGTSSWAYSASNALFASESLVAISASYVSGVLTGSLHGTSSWAYSASNALFASESLFAISASYVSGVLTGSLYGTASWAHSASNALFASESLVAISASYVSGVLTGSLYGTASWASNASSSIIAQTASFLEGFDPSSITTTYLDLTDTLDTDFTDKDEFVPVVDETNSKLVLKQTVPSASFAITASFALTSATSADTSTTSEFANTAGAIDLGLADSARHRIALTDLDGYGPEEKIFSPGIDQFVHDAQKGATGFNMGIEPPFTPESSFFPAQKLPHFSIETSNLIRIHGDLETQRPYTVLVDPINNAINLPEPAAIGKKYGDVGIVLDGFARSIYSATNIQDGINIDPTKTLNSDLVRMISYTSKGILAVGKSHQIHNGLNLHAGIGGDIRFYAELGQTDAPGGIEGGAGPIGMRVLKEIPRNANQGAVSIKGKLSVGNGPDGASSLSTPNDIQFIVHNPNNITRTDSNGLFDNEAFSPLEGNSFGIKCTSNINYRSKFVLTNNSFQFDHLPSPNSDVQLIPFVIQTMKRGLLDQDGQFNLPIGAARKGVRLFLDNKTGNITLPANHGDTENSDFELPLDYNRFKSPFKLFVEGVRGLSNTFSGVHRDNLQGNNLFNTGKALHVNNGITHLAASTVIGSPFRKATHEELLFVNNFNSGDFDAPFGPDNILGSVLVSSTGEHAASTPNSSSIVHNPFNEPQSTPPILDEDGNILAGGNHFGILGFPITSYGGEFRNDANQNNIEAGNSDLNNTLGFLVGGTATADKYSRITSDDFKLLVNGVGEREFGGHFANESNPGANIAYSTLGGLTFKDNAIRAIGRSQFQARSNYNQVLNPNTNTELNKLAIESTGSIFAVGDRMVGNFNKVIFGTDDIYEPGGTNGEVIETIVSINGQLLVDNNDISNPSDRKLKQNIVNLDSQLDNIKALQPREFEWKKNNKKSVGVIAQELQEVYPSLVSENDDTLYVNYTGMIPYLIKGMQEQQEMIEKLTSKINELEKKIDK